MAKHFDTGSLTWGAFKKIMADAPDDALIVFEANEWYSHIGEVIVPRYNDDGDPEGYIAVTLMAGPDLDPLDY